jgi:hypothetical protein
MPDLEGDNINGSGCSAGTVSGGSNERGENDRAQAERCKSRGRLEDTAILEAFPVNFTISSLFAQDRIQSLRITLRDLLSFRVVAAAAVEEEC